MLATAPILDAQTMSSIDVIQATTFGTMRSTMMDAPLLVSRILEHGSTVHGAADVRTWTGAGSSRMTYAEVGAKAAQLAHALRDDLGVTGDQRVATFMWNNAEHLVAYLAVPSMGAVLHTLNLRLFPDQITYIANHAEDHVVLVDSTLIPLLAKVLPAMSTVEHVVVVGGATPHRWATGSPYTGGKTCCATSRSGSTGPRSTSATPPPSATPQVPPATPRVWRTRTARSGCTRCRYARRRASGSARPTASSRSCRCFTRCRGGSRSPR
ncbi:hypothetical protein Pflav_075270 [Phytohabitans flavus]|uniref:AMP-dependent synthetase/ligase domain-containing protein n=1 Tax=Phytohabitans flavus TaxID=1076124 RepID=A0A6F8Y4Y1_9ACTN|nr:hypothetical protein Pflav_075270 [Phytohabitans flavus]